MKEKFNTEAVLQVNGHHVNKAARLEASCLPGSVAVSREVYLRTSELMAADVFKLPQNPALVEGEVEVEKQTVVQQGASASASSGGVATASTSSTNIKK